jgi:hypothetical protein
MNTTDYAAPMREHAWRYFELHANQRISIFNYFLVVSGAIAAGLATTLQGTPRFASLGIVLGGLLVLVSFVFWKLDQRSSFLIKQAEMALTETESAFPVESSCLFMFEPRNTKATSASMSWWHRPWTFGKAFRIVFIVMAVFGISGAGLSALKFLCILTW